MKKLLLVLLLLPFLAEAQTPPIDLTRYASPASSYSNPSWLTALAWSKLTSTPTTVSGYGITDGVAINTVCNFLTKTGNYTILSADFAASHLPILHLWADCTGGAVTVTLPSAASLSGYTIHVGKTDNSANLLTISGCSYDNLIGIQNTVKTFVSNGTNWQQN